MNALLGSAMTSNRAINTIVELYSPLVGSVVPGGAMFLCLERRALNVVIRLPCPENAGWLHES